MINTINKIVEVFLSITAILAIIAILWFVALVAMAEINSNTVRKEQMAERKQAYQASLDSCLATNKPLYICEKEIKKFKFGIDLTFRPEK